MLEKVYGENSVVLSADCYANTICNDEVDAYILERDIEKINDCLSDSLLSYIESNFDKRWDGVVALVEHKGYVVKYHYITYDENELQCANDIECELSNIISKFQTTY